MKKILMISFLIFTILANCLNISYATLTVTEDALQNSLNELVKELKADSTDDSTEDNPSFIVTEMKIDSANKKIIVSTQDGNTCDLSYDLSDKPTFSREILIEEGMSYDEYERTLDTLTAFPLYAYTATIMTTGISFDRAFVYSGYTFLIATLESAAEKDPNNSITLFPNNGDSVINYVDASYPTNKETFTDSKLLNSLTSSIEKENLSETSRKLKCTITVNPDADFSKIDEYAEQLKDNINDSFNDTIENQEGASSIVPEVLPQNVLIIPPTKTKYDVGENLNLDGLKITAVYPNDKIEEVTKGYTVTGFNKNKKGIQTVKISYKGFSTTYEVKVGNSSTKVDLNEIEKLPQTGDFFDIVDGLYLIVGILSIALIYIVYKSIKYSKIEK